MEANLSSHRRRSRWATAWRCCWPLLVLALVSVLAVATLQGCGCADCCKCSCSGSYCSATGTISSSACVDCDEQCRELCSRSSCPFRSASECR